MLEQERLYDIYMSENGDILIAIEVRDGEPDNPRIIYNGADIALLYRSKEFVIALDYIHPEARDNLKSAELITIAEIYKAKGREQEPVREYEVPVRIMSKIPVQTKDLPEHLSEADEEKLAKLENWDIPDGKFEELSKNLDI